jgi:superfamily II DNA or RNA helicase
VCSSDLQNLLEEFYKPLFADALSYDRAVGFFSAEALSANLKGISSLVQNGGRMRLIIGHPLDDDEFYAVKTGYGLREFYSFYEKELESFISNQSNLKINRLVFLSQLIAANKLEIKFALRRRGMYHEKIGIVTDANQDTLVFQGSANETEYALNSGFNAESIMTFCSWKKEIFQDYGTPCVEGFENLWTGNQLNTITIDVPSEFYEKIAAATHNDKILIKNIDALESEYYDEFFSKQEINVPEIPRVLNGKKFEILEHQKRAISKWQTNNYKGILALATGSGKTITSCIAATKLYEARRKANRKLALVVAVPYKNLAKQWVENLRLFNIHPIECWNTSSSWSTALSQQITSFNMSTIDFFCVVVVNKTLSTELFEHHVKKIDINDLMLVGDECHNHGAARINSFLPPAYYRMGLSATPFKSDDDEFDSPFPDESRDRIISYYGNIVDSYSLSDAINDGVLCEYEYFIIPTYLTSEEQDIYDTLSVDISSLLAIQRGAGLTNIQSESLRRLCSRRSRLLGNASNKLNKLKEIASNFPRDQRKNVLFYCGEGSVDRALNDTATDERTIQEVSRILKNGGWVTSRFTSSESVKERESIMRNFKDGSIDALVSIRVLDEGFDVPACRTAFILASTKNPRQYVQRRGRVLRKQEGKMKASIYDFVILPFNHDENSPTNSLVTSELERVNDFCKLAINRASIEETIETIGLKNGR